MKMLLATDGSACSLGAAQFLSRFRCSSDDEITVLYVIPGAPHSGEDGPQYADLMQVKKGIAPKILDATVAELKDLRAKISTVAATGHPTKAITLRGQRQSPPRHRSLLPESRSGRRRGR
jgi:nucleotide-binding universal stress UspA family protein